MFRFRATAYFEVRSPIVHVMIFRYHAGIMYYAKRVTAVHRLDARAINSHSKLDFHRFSDRVNLGSLSRNKTSKDPV